MPARSSAFGHHLLLLVLLAALAGGCARAGGEAFQPTLNSPVLIEPDGSVGQTLNPVTDVVRGVDVPVATFAAEADPAGTLELSLLPADETGADEPPLGTARIAGADLADSAWVTARFEPPVRHDGPLLLTATWDGATTLALWANRPPDEAAASPFAPGEVPANDPYLDGQLVIDGRPAEGDLAFRVRGAGDAAAGLEQLQEVARSTAARLADGPAFALAWALLVAGSAALAVRGLRRT